MKTFLLAIFLSVAAFAQNPNGLTQSPVDPSGGCGYPQSNWQNYANQKQWVCGNDFVWHQIISAVPAAVPFSNITTGTNTVPATMTIGNGSSMTFSGTGVNNANQINGTALSGLATGILRNTTATGVPSSAELSGDATTSGSNVVTVAKVNGGSLPISSTYVGTNGSGQIVTATTPVTSATIAGTANQITASGTCAITTTGTCTLSIPSVLTLPGTINNITLTAPATAATFTLANNKTFTVSNSLTLAGTDSTTMTFPSTTATIARTDAAQSFTGNQTFSTGIITNTMSATSDFTFTGNVGNDIIFSSSTGGTSFRIKSGTGGISLTAGAIFALQSSAIQAWNSDTALCRNAAGSLYVGTSSASCNSSGNLTLNNATVGGTLGVTGIATLNGRTVMQGASETYAISLKYNASGGVAFIGASNSATPDIIFSNNAGSSIASFTNARTLNLAATPGASAGDIPLCLSTGNDVHSAAATCGVSLLALKMNAKGVHGAVDPLTHGLDWVMALKPSEYTLWQTGQREVGFVADWTEQISPLLAAYDRDGKLGNVRDRAILAALVNAVQELAAR